jgi:virginiamycin A acetyltransferase
MNSSSETAKRRHHKPMSGSSSAINRTFSLIKPALKGLAITLGLVCAVVPGLTCIIERIVGDRDALFLFWGQAFALIPGLPGSYLRKCFYYLTLGRCSLNCEIGFLTYLHDRRTQIGKRVNIGTAVGIGYAIVGDGCLIASRVSILSGDSQHRQRADGTLTAFDRKTARQVRIGRDTWIGEGAIVMAEVGSRCIIAAGSVVSKPIPSGALVTGNPARIIRSLIDGRNPKSDPSETLPAP